MRQVVTMTDEQKIPGWLEPLFWDIDPGQLSFNKHKVIIVERVLNFGDHHALHWLLQVYPASEIRQAVTLSPGLTVKTARCWQNIFALKEEEMRCFGRLWENVEKPC